MEIAPARLWWSRVDSKTLTRASNRGRLAVNVPVSANGGLCLEHRRRPMAAFAANDGVSLEWLSSHGFDIGRFGVGPIKALSRRLGGGLGWPCLMD